MPFRPSDRSEQQEDVGLSIPEASKKRWCRPPVAPFDPETKSISFQQMDTDYYTYVLFFSRYLSFPVQHTSPTAHCFHVDKSILTSAWLQKPREDMPAFAAKSGTTYKV